MFGAHALIIFTSLRAILLAVNWPDLPQHVIPIVKSFVIGFRMDLAVIFVLSLPFVFYAALMPDRFFQNKWHLRAIEGLYIAGLFAFIFLNAADYFFFDEFNSRFNYIAIDYLFSSPTEVVGNIWASYPVLVVVFVVGLLTYLLHRPLHPIFDAWANEPLSWRTRLAAPPVMVLVTAFFLKTVGISMVSTDPNRIMGEVGSNGFYTFGYALLTDDMNYHDYYQTIGEQEAFARVRSRIFSTNDRALNRPDNPLLRRVPARKGLGKINVVIILEESLGAKFSAKLRGHPLNLTPMLDRLMPKSLVFTRFYSTGTRTVRGLEAVLASFPPIPGASIVKRPHPHRVATLARTLKAAGYETLFIYGGRGMFDNMKGFALNNGFDRFIEQSDFPTSTFSTVWGVCDEDTFSKSLETFDRLHAEKKPFFATILTVSNHKPYTYPKGRIDLDPDQHSRDHAVKYADWALGQFFEKAPSHAFFKNTLFVVLGDHGARVYGADFIPIESYEVPMIMYAPSLLPQARAIDTVGSSMDVAPTILGLMGLAYDSTFFGRDLLTITPEKGYALVQHDRDVGLFDGEQLAVLSAPKTVRAYRFEPSTKRFSPAQKETAQAQSMILDAISFYQTAFDLYMRGSYKDTSDEGE